MSVRVDACVAAAVLMGSMAAHTAGEAPSRPHIVPASTRVALRGDGDLTFKLDTSLDGIALDVDCVDISAHGVTPADGLSFDLTPPSFMVHGGTSCTDSLGSSDEVRSNDKNGAWLYSLNSAGTEWTLRIPKAGATEESLAIEHCTITLASSGAMSISGPIGKAASGSVSTSASKGCSTQKASTISSEFAITPPIHVSS